MKRIPIRLTNKDVRTRVEYVQGTNSIPIILQVVDWEIPEGSEARIYVKKPSGKEVYNSAEVSGNEVTIQPTTQMFAEFGRQLGQIQIVDGDDIAATFLLEFDIEKNLAFESTAVESSDEYGILDELIKQAQAAISDTRAATIQANIATSTANNAAETANEAASSANAAAAAANNAAEELQEKVNAGDFTASVTVGTVTTGNPGSQASVVNSGTDKDAVLDFTIPKGDTGSVENISEQSVMFTEASTDDKISSGETLSTLFGKTSRLFTRVGTAETNITNIQSDIEISNETIAAFKALGWTPPEGGAVIESLLNLIFDRAHPVGSYYWSSDSTNPSQLFGGTWEQVTDTFILAAGTTYPAGSSGGEATHTLTSAEMPAHRHALDVRYNDGSGSAYVIDVVGPTKHGLTYRTETIGASQPHNNMPPYIVAYCWRRTA